tara:strand:- start:1006 stop:1617 length:612 start_codon:yes stop_codon:yes gene_type:complete
MSVDFSAKTIETQQQLLARHLPDGKVWENKFDINTNLGKLLLGLAAEYLRISVLIEGIMRETDINQTELLISEWQTSVGIPDDCLDGTGTLEDQRRDVLLKLTNFGGIQTAQDFVDLAALFGFTAVVSNGTQRGVFPMLFPIRFFDNRKTAVHTIIVDLEGRRDVFALSFPLPFTSSLTGLIECLFLELRPANCQIIFEYGAI